MNQDKPAVTIKDIVRETGFGLGTVSRALNNSPGVKEATRHAILEAAARLGFVPSQAARTLGAKQDPLMAVGLVIPHLIHPFFSEVTRGVYTTLRGKPVRLSLHVVFEDEKKEEELDRVLAEGRENALIIVATELSEAQERTIADRGIRAILVDTPHPRLPFVAVDNRLGGKLAADHLASLHPAGMAWCGDAYRSRQAVEREESFLERAKALGREDILVRHCHIKPDDLDRTLSMLLDELPQPAGIAFHSDLMVYRALELCRRRGLAAGEDIHLLGYDDLPQTALLGLSTIAQPMQELGCYAAKYILATTMIKPKKWLTPRLVFRGSSK